jgi:hypothetical protein
MCHLYFAKEIHRLAESNASLLEGTLLGPATGKAWLPKKEHSQKKTHRTRRSSKSVAARTKERKAVL